MRRIRHAWRLLIDIAWMSYEYRAGWLLPIVLVIILVSVLAFMVQLTVPFAAYTLF